MIKFIIAQGIGFSPGSVKYMPTLGFSSGAAPIEADTPHLFLLLGIGL